MTDKVRRCYTGLKIDPGKYLDTTIADEEAMRTVMCELPGGHAGPHESHLKGWEGNRMRDAVIHWAVTTPETPSPRL